MNFFMNTFIILRFLCKTPYVILARLAEQGEAGTMRNCPESILDAPAFGEAYQNDELLIKNSNYCYTNYMNRKKIFIYFILFFSLFLILVRLPKVQADRYATCDACGYCPIIVNDNTNIDTPSGECIPTITPPGNWKQCAKCLYPSLYPTDSIPNAGNCSTLKVDSTTNQAPSAFPGRQYTAIGCITSEGGFNNNTGSGASSFTQALFDLVVFKMIGGIALLYLMYGAFLVITSQSDPEKLNHGKRVVYGAITGLVFVLTSVLLVNIIGSNMLKIPGFRSVP